MNSAEHFLRTSLWVLSLQQPQKCQEHHLSMGGMSGSSTTPTSHSRRHQSWLQAQG